MSRVWIDGRLVPADEAAVSYDDHGVTVGDGVFETIKLDHGAPFALEAHLDRLDRSLASLRLGPVDRTTLNSAIASVIASDGPGADGFLRITVTGGRGPLGSPRGDAKPTVIVAVAAGASEALFANNAGNLCEGTGSNVFVVIDDRLVTPPLTSGCLAGVTRALLLDLLGETATEADVAMSRLGDITEMFLVSTGREVQPVSLVTRAEGSMSLAVSGPHTTAARAAWVDAYG